MGKNNSFRKPRDQAENRIIMANGTKPAAFRDFIETRAARKKANKNITPKAKKYKNHKGLK